MTRSYGNTKKIKTEESAMQTDRIRQLKKFLEDEPQDPFLLYALATEYSKTDKQEALRYYQKLLEEHPDYVPTYYHAAALFAELEETKKAEATYRKGLEKAQKAGDAHALRELQTAYTNWQFEQE